MHQDQVGRQDVERAVLRIRAAGIALGLTLLLLSPRSDQTGAGAALLGYALIVVITWAARHRAAALPALAVGIDVLYAAALSLLLPPAAGPWALYAFAIGTAALGFGPIGAVAATAGSIVGYDLGIALRIADLRAVDLWPVQLLLAIGLLVAELGWAASRGDLTRRRLRTFALVQRDLMAARTEGELLDRITDHAVRSFGGRSAWIEAGPEPWQQTLHQRGPAAGDERARAAAESSWLLDDPPSTRLRCTFDDPQLAATGVPALRDLATDAAPLLAAARERSRLGHAKATLDRTLAGIRALEGDRVSNAVLAEILAVTSAIAGPAALVRPADGSVVAGDLAAEEALALTRDTAPPALVRDRPGSRAGVVVAAGPGLMLAAVDPERTLTPDDLGALAALGEIAALAIGRISERDVLVERNDALQGRIGELGDRLQARDDAVASAVHELRTPLTSVHAYAQLTSRNLQSVQEQVQRLDRLIADLIPQTGERHPELVAEDVDLLQEARGAGRRTTLVAEREVRVSARGRGPFVVLADRSRIQQVLENLLGNAAKFSPPDAAIGVEIERGVDEVIVMVTDTGAGIPAAELERIFERHYRGVAQRDTVPGKGIGLAIAREIIVAHGGRIWAASGGPGAGSTFFFTLPAPWKADPAELPEDTGGAGRRAI